MERKPYVPSGRRAENPRAVNDPEAGHYLIRLIRGGVRVPAQIIFEDGKWSATIGGVLQGEPHADPVHAAKVLSIWWYGERIDKTEHDFQVSVIEHVKKHQPDHPAANPRQPIDLTKMKPLF